MSRFFSIVLLLTAGALGSAAAEWHGYATREIAVDGYKGYVVIPRRAAAGSPWLWRARFPEYHPEAAIALLDRGFYVAYFDLPNIFGNPAAVLAWDRFYDAVRKKFGLAPKAAIEAVSRGGLFAYNWTLQNPDKVACIFAESPVCDMKSWPGGRGKGIGSAKDWQEALAAYGFTNKQMMEFRQNPVDYAERLAQSRIPLLNVVCRQDQVAPPSENTEPFAARYRQGGGRIEVHYNQKGPVTDHGHHFDLDDPMLEVRFVLAHTGP